jgi:hypothetical protein
MASLMARFAGAFKRACTELGLAAKPSKASGGGLGALLADDLDRARSEGK